MSDVGRRDPIDSGSGALGIRAEDLIFILVLVGFALALGSLGYYYSTQLTLLDSFYNASLILSGMGPANTITTVGGKFFASFFSLFSGFIFIIVVTIFIQRSIENEFK